jgi:NADH-quinone oxidoreductase subunit K
VTVGPVQYAILSAIVFAIGLYGVMARRNALHALVPLLLLFTAPVIALVGFAHIGQGGGAGPPEGDAVAFFAILAMAGEAITGLSVVLLLWRRTGSADIDDFLDVEG